MDDTKKYWLHLNRSHFPGTSVTYALGCAPEPRPGFGGAFPTARYTSWEVLLHKLRLINIPDRTVAEAGQELTNAGYYLIQDVSLTLQQLRDLELPGLSR